MSNVRIQSVVRAMNILEYISLKNGAGVSEIARELGLNKSTAFGLIKTLESERYIVKDKNNDNYKIGLKIYSLSKNALNKSDFQEYVKPYLVDLSEKYGETIHLVVATENEGIYIDKIESTKSIRIHSEIGDKLPLHCTGVGKAIMAYKNNEQVNSYINEIGLKKYTDNTITDPETLYKELNDIRERGYSFDNEEQYEDLFCIAVPILNKEHKPVYAISISMPMFRKTTEIVEEIVTDLLKIKEESEVYFQL